MQYHTPIRKRPLSLCSITIVVSNTSTAVSEVSVTSERRETTSSILSNRGDEDLSIVSSDARARSQSQVDCIE